MTEALAQDTIRFTARDAARHERAARKRGESNGGGAGIRTRVRKYILAGIYDAYPRLKSRSRREAAARTARSQPQRNLAATVQGNR